jgi:hypothetical protein
MEHDYKCCLGTVLEIGSRDLYRGNISVIDLLQHMWDDKVSENKQHVTNSKLSLSGKKL